MARSRRSPGRADRARGRRLRALIVSAWHGRCSASSRPHRARPRSRPARSRPRRCPPTPAPEGSVQQACAAPASTSARTRRGCSSPSATASGCSRSTRSARSRASAAALVEDGDDRRGQDRRGRRGRRSSSSEPRATLGAKDVRGVATAAIRRAGNGDRSARRDPRRMRPRRRGPLGRGGGAARVRRRRRDARPRPRRERSAWSTSAAAPRSSSSATAPDQIGWCDLVRRRVRRPGRRTILHSDPPAAAELSAARAQIARRARRTCRAAPGRGGGRRRQRGVAAHAWPARVLDARRLRARARSCSGAEPASAIARPVRARPRARAAAARRAADPARRRRGCSARAAVGRGGIREGVLLEARSMSDPSARSEPPEPPLPPRRRSPRSACGRRRAATAAWSGCSRPSTPTPRSRRGGTCRRSTRPAGSG